MSEIAIKVEHLTKIYKLYNKPSDRLREALGMKVQSRDHYALNDVSFHVKKGETVGIIGTNGSGKSTILKIITGVLNPSEGNLEVNGRISALLELGAGFNMEYSGIENVYLNGTMMGFSREEIDAKLDDILEFADIGDFVYQPVKSYSSGMFVRLAFAVAINIEPEILIVDEALSVGDVFFQAKCYRRMEEMLSGGTTLLFVSHDAEMVKRMCRRAVWLNDGVMMDPRLLSRVESPSGVVRLRYSQKVYGQAMSAETAQKLDGYMKDVVKNGTGTKAQVDGLSIAGKTGSAESSNNGQAVTHAWFVGYLDSETAPYAVCVMVEEGGSGGSVAAPIAGEIFAYLGRMGQ